MNLDSVSSSSSILNQLEANGLTKTKAKLVASELAASEQSGSTNRSTSAISPAVRSAFESKIAADVSSGKLSASDAVAIKRTMDELPNAAGKPAPANATAPAPSSQAHDSGGGGSGGSAKKTELSESVTISGSTMDTVVTYTDGTTSSTTTTATDTDRIKYDKQLSTEASSAHEGYTPNVDKGSLVDQLG